MDKQKKMNKNQMRYLYLPLWVILVAAVVCIIAGAFIGYQINKSDDNVLPDDSISTGDVSNENQQAGSSLSETDKSQWNLILVNQWNLLPENYNPELEYLSNGHAIDKRAYSDLQDMLDDCRAEGLSPVICSSYRTLNRQKELFNSKVNEYIAYGYSEDKAKRAAGELVAVPGTSEHQLGLALDIVDISNQILDERQENTAVQKWLMNNSWK